MFHSNKLIICCLILGIAPLVRADVEIKPETINTHPGPYRPWSLEFQQVNPEHLHGITAEKLAKMSLSDPLLKYAYMIVFMSSAGTLDNLEPEQALVLKDMRRRGDSVTPMLLKLAMENQETGYECALLDRIDEVGTINLDPYLEYSRNLLRERTQTMSASLAGCASKLLSRHGSKEDIEILERVLEERTYVASFVSISLKELKRRLDSPKQVSRPMLQDRQPTSEAVTDNTADSARRPSTAKDVEENPSKPWIAWGLLITALTGMVWILLKKVGRRGKV
jgi:hypothetical protein